MELSLEVVAPYIVVFVGLIVLAALVFMLPKPLVDRDLGKELSQRLTPAERVEAINGARTALVQAAGGVLLVAGAYFTWSQIQVSREGQVTDRFTKAVEQLGNEERNVRLGGIYALERIARDSPDDRESVAQMLTAYVRRHSPWQGSPKLPTKKKGLNTSSKSAPECPKRTEESDLDAMPTMTTRKADVQAALTVLSRRPSPESEAIDLSLIEVDLRQTDLGDGYFRGIDFEGTNLQAVNFSNANLDEAVFAGTTGVYCAVHMEWSNFRSASIKNAHLENVYLEGADLTDTDFTGSHFCGAHLENADFSEAILDNTNFCKATANSKTLWPKGFNPEAAGVVVK
jgi:hypothetical protein